VNYPSTEKKGFKIQLDNNPYVKGDILNMGQMQVVVTKIYKRTWWRRLLTFFGFKTKLFDCIKVKPYENTAS